MSGTASFGAVPKNLFLLKKTAWILRTGTDKKSLLQLLFAFLSFRRAVVFLRENAPGGRREWKF
jgi:hypothetical protein